MNSIPPPPKQLSFVFYQLFVNMTSRNRKTASYLDVICRSHIKDFWCWNGKLIMENWSEKKIQKSWKENSSILWRYAWYQRLPSGQDYIWIGKVSTSCGEVKLVQNTMEKIEVTTSYKCNYFKMELYWKLCSYRRLCNFISSL